MVKNPGYLLLDAARLNWQIGNAKALNPDHASLYKGRREENLADVGPYLFIMPDDPDFSSWYMNTGWGGAWGVLLHSEFSFKEVYRHFQNLLLVKTEDGQELYFRFYDPRVLRVFLPTCDEQQLTLFFGPVDRFICEDEDPCFGLVFSCRNNRLVTERVTADKIIGVRAR